MIWNNCQVDEAEFKETLKKFAPVISILLTYIILGTQ